MSSARGRLLTTNADQVLSSGCAYLLVMLVARASAPGELGLFLISFGVVTVSSAVGRAAFGAILGMDVPALPSAAADELQARSGGALVLLGSVLGAGLALLAVPADGPVRWALLLLGLALPLVLLQDLARFGLVARAAPGRALTADALWVAPPLVLVVTDVARGHESSPGLGAVVWVGGLLLSVGWLSATGHLPRPRFDGVVGWAAADARRRHLAADAAMGGLAPVGNAVGAAAVASTAATGAIRGAAAAFAPLSTLALAVSLSAVPEARRQAPDRALRFLLALTGGLVVLSGAWTLLLLALPDAVGTTFLGETWHAARPLLPYLGVEYVGLAVWTGATAMLRFSNATRTALGLRLVYAPATLVLPVLVLALTDDVRAFVATLAVLGLAVGGAGLTLGVRWVRRVVRSAQPG